jgi:hypothetical protein
LQWLLGTVAVVWLVISLCTIAITSIVGLRDFQSMAGSSWYSECDSGHVPGQLCNLFGDLYIVSLSTLVPIGSVAAVHVLCNLKTLSRVKAGGSLLRIIVSNVNPHETAVLLRVTI